MILVFCFAVIFACTFYAHKYLKRTTKPLRFKEYNVASVKGRKSIKEDKMSDDEFQEPSASNSRWLANLNKVSNPRGGGLFRWKRRPPANISDSPGQKNEKRQKVEVVHQEQSSKIETIQLTDDESELEISDDSATQRTPSKIKSVTNETVTVYDVDTDPEDSPPVRKKFVFDISPTKLGSPVKTVTAKGSPIKYEPKYKNVPLPPGMPPVIAGIPVKFPITPYKSQISVMNAVIRGCKNKEHCLLESPTGSGKTLALLCAALAWQSNFTESHFSEAGRRFKNHDPDSASGLCQPGGSNDCCNSNSVFDPEDSLEEQMKQCNTKVPKIYYGSRTHKQIEQVIREFKKTAYSDKPMTILSSRELSCIRDPVKGVSKTQICNDLRDPAKKKSCEFYTEKNKQKMASNTALSCLGFDTPWDIEDLVELGKRECACPYFAARSLMEEADIIFCPYNYLIDPVIRDTMKINLTDDIIIVDEAHNIESICRDAGSADFREDYLGESIEDCKLVRNLSGKPTYEPIVNYLHDLLELINEQHLPEPSNAREEVTSDCWTGEETWTLFKMRKLGGDSFAGFRSGCKQAIAEYKEVKEDIQMGNRVEESTDEHGKKKKSKQPPAITFTTKKLLEELLMALECIQHKTYCLDYRCTISMAFHYDAKVKVEENTWTSGHGGKRLRTLRFMCMNPAVIFAQMAKATRCVILASGTLSPTSTFESELGTRFAHKLHANHVVPKEQVYVRGIPCGPKGTVLRATYKNVQTLPFKDDLGRLIVDVCQTVPHGILCFFSSYSMMTSQLERWQETDVWYELQRCKHILKEPRSNYDLDEIMTEYRSVIRDTADGPSCGITGSLLFAVFRGKIAEGIDFSDNEARCVLTIGIPYAVQTDTTVKLKREYNDINRSKGLLPGGEWYSVQAYRALNQALGRCIRHMNDWGAVLLVDERLLSPSCFSYLPKWIREMRLEGSHYNLKEELKTFVNRQQVRDKERASD